MSIPPAILDGAGVLCWAWSGEEPFGVLECTNERSLTAIHGFAICTYGDGTYYRFSCDADWEVEQDAMYLTIDEAMHRLPDQYRKLPVRWRDFVDNE